MHPKNPYQDDDFDRHHETVFKIVAVIAVLAFTAVMAFLITSI
jgi:hypothetical protein